MKFVVSMKDPDTLFESIGDAVRTEIKALNLPKDELDAIYDLRVEKVGELCSQWFRYGEYLDVEIDTEAKTCTVVLQEGQP